MINCFLNYFFNYVLKTIFFVLFFISVSFPICLFAQAEGTIQHGLKIEAYGLFARPFIPLQNSNQIHIKNVSICYLDLYDKAKTKLNQTISTDIFQDNFQNKPQITAKNDDPSLGAKYAHQYQEDIQKIGSYYQCRHNAQLIGITKVPAIVFTQQQKSYVIYGENDLNKAILEYRQFISQTRKRAEYEHI